MGWGELARDPFLKPLHASSKGPTERLAENPGIFFGRVKKAEEPSKKVYCFSSSMSPCSPAPVSQYPFI